MLQSWRWFAPSDPISLRDIRQAGITGIVTALHHIPCGQLWTLEEIEKRRDLIAASAPGLHWTVVESLPVHEEIKTRSGDWQGKLAIYNESLANLGRAGLKIICYNFMPVLDWTRTELEHEIEDSSTVLLYEHDLVAAFDLFILRREGAEADYDEACKMRALSRYEAMDDATRSRLSDSILLGLPGTVDDFSVEDFRGELARYDGIDANQLRKNLHDFLREIMPTAEEYGIKMAIHPDDPPWTIFGLPRIMNREGDYRALIEAVPSPSNGITLCTGSLGASPENNAAALFERFSDRVYFAHLRNVRFDLSTPGSFHESPCHLEGATDMHRAMSALVMEEERRRITGQNDWKIPTRPDHGKLFDRDQNDHSYGGYSSTGRMIGIAELRGLEYAIRKTADLSD